MTNALYDLNRKVHPAGISFEYTSFEIITMPDHNSLKQFEVAARTCYRSEDKTTEDNTSAISLLHKILGKNHGAMIEFLPDMHIKIRTNRGVTHEIVRMRLCSFAQESTRYVKYRQVPYIIPGWASAISLLENPQNVKNGLFLSSCMAASEVYSERLQAGHSAQEARGSLNNDTAAYINVKTNMREWLHIFGLRCDSPTHPDMRMLACGIADYLWSNNDLMKEIFTYFPDIEKNIQWFRKEKYVETIEKTHYVVPYIDGNTGREYGEPWTDK